MGTSVQWTGGNSSFITGSNLYTGCTNTAQGWVQNVTVSPHVPANAIYVTPTTTVMSPQTAAALHMGAEPETEPDPAEVNAAIEQLLDLRRKLDECP